MECGHVFLGPIYILPFVLVAAVLLISASVKVLLEYERAVLFTYPAKPTPHASILHDILCVGSIAGQPPSQCECVIKMRQCNLSEAPTH